jgi:hypothetical protein
MTKRRKVIIGVIIGIPVVLVGVALLLVTVFRPSLPEPVASVEEKTIPTAWLTESTGDETDKVNTQDIAADATEASPPIRTRAPFSSNGALVFVSNGRSFGTESYELQISEEGTTLSSAGYFSFKVVLATVRVTYTQSLKTDDELRPTDYTLDFNAPLGLGQRIQAQISADTATLLREEVREIVPVKADRILVLGTFSTYALVPALFEARAEGDGVDFDVLIFGGPSHQASSQQSEDGDLPVLTVERLQDAILETETVRLVVDRYRIQSELGESFLFAKGKEFIGFLAGDGEGTLLVYRSDYFPKGFTLVR